MALTEATTIAGFTTRGDAITLRQLGMNLAQGYEQFGTLPWQKFDEVQANVGARYVRFPGGTQAETPLTHANSNA